MFLHHISSSNFYSLFVFSNPTVSVSFGYINTLDLDSLQELKLE